MSSSPGFAIIDAFVVHNNRVRAFEVAISICFPFYIFNQIIDIGLDLDVKRVFYLIEKNCIFRLEVDSSVGSMNPY